MQAIKAANTPKITPLANGSFALLQYPDGRTEVRSFEEVQKFLLEQEQAKALPTLLPKLIDQQNKAQEKAVAARNNYRNVADKTSFLISQIDNLTKYSNNRDWIDKTSKNFELISLKITQCHSCEIYMLIDLLTLKKA